ncbi:MAG: PG0541 family transporter-associated protein [Candidatus Omnitrophota bacterium]
MKMVMIVYNEALDNEVMEILKDCALKSYTKITEVFGCGISSGTHLGTDIWPGRNNILYVACEEKESKQIITSVKEIRKNLGVEGIKAFLIPLEEMT